MMTDEQTRVKGVMNRLVLSKKNELMAGGKKERMNEWIREWMVGRMRKEGGGG